jgi:hypothetical protein
MPLRASSVARIREIVNPAYEEEVSDLVRGRHRWKASRDLFETTAKLTSGFASIAAFTASSIPIVDNGFTIKWIAFGAGCLGTLSLTLLLFSNYSAKESRERTSELNALLRMAGITPMPQLALGDGGDIVESNRVSLDMSAYTQGNNVAADVRQTAFYSPSISERRAPFEAAPRTDM